jgi:hypothetical protein
MYSIAFTAIVLAILGNILYGRNAWKVEKGIFSATPWVIFFLLGANDCVNYLASDSNWFEVIAGLIVMIGPACIVAIIIFKGKREKRLSLESSREEKVIVAFAVASMFVITLLEVLALKKIILFGDSVYFEWSALVFAFMLDAVALMSLKKDIDASPAEFELSSWLCFLLASILASYFDIVEMWLELNWIAFLLISENILVSFFAIKWILTARK